MGGYAIRMRFEIDADPGTVRRCLTTREGIAAWWSSRVSGEPGVDGGRLEVEFPDVPAPFDFTVSLGDETVVWEVGNDPAHWKGTAVRWQVEQGDGRTILRFVHDGYEPDNPVIEVVTPAWALIISRLQAYAETGRPQPFFDF